MSWVTDEVDFGDTPALWGSFTLTDEDITEDSVVVVVQAAGPYTDKGTLADESEMDQIRFTAESGDGEATIRWRASGPVKGYVSYSYTVTT